jgi:hypothetical protein
MRVMTLILLLAGACSDDKADRGSMEGDPLSLSLPGGRYESGGGRGKSAAVEIFPDPDAEGQAGRFFAELDDFCFAQRCVQALVACGTYDLDGARLRFEVDEYRRANGSPETSPHRMSAAYDVHPQSDGSLILIEIGDDDHPASDMQQVIRYVGGPRHDVDGACAIPL